MRFSIKILLYQFACSLITMCNLVSSDDIPAMLWNIKGNVLQMKPVSALGHNDKILTENLKDIHRQESSIIVFAVNKLSLEDFSASDRPSILNNTLHNIESFLDQQPHIILPSVKDPLNYIHKAHCGVQEIVVDNKIDESIMQSVSSAIQKSCVVILHILDDGIVAKEGDLTSVFLPSFESSHKNVVGVFTGVKSSWGSPSNDHHIFRNLLAVSAADDYRYVNFSSCIIMYAESASVKLGREGNTSVTLNFTENLDLTGSSCDNITILQLNFKMTGLLSSVTIKFNFTKIQGAWKTDGTLSMTGERAYADEIDLNTGSIEAPVGFSYSCGDLVVIPQNYSFYEVSIILAGFQIQPYEVKEAFSESFDCVPFFTIPIWMGIFVSLLFIVITNIGVYALFSVHTMDRFDDPKGKTISVATTGD